MTPAEKKALRALCGKRTKPELKQLFRLIRANDDRVLLAALAPAKKAVRKAKGDPLLRDLDARLKTLQAPAAEKADLLVEHLAKKHRRKFAFEPKGMADAVRRLRPKLSDDQIRAGAESLMAEMAALYDARETVV